jgi:hypothetical protein
MNDMEINNGFLSYYFFYNHVEEAVTTECRLTEWSPWTSCSVTCGHGIRTRRRTYLVPDKAFRQHCNERTHDMSSCYATSCLSTMMSNHSSSSMQSM